MRRLVGEVWHGCTFVYRSGHFPLFSVFMLALGFACVCCVGSLAYRLLWAPLPYQQGHELVEVEISLDGSPYQPELSGHEIDHLQRHSRSLSGVAGVWLRRTALGLPQESGRQPSADVRLGIVTWNFFDLLGAQLALGRPPRASDALESASPVAFLSHRLWTQRLGADPGLVGSTVLVNGLPMRVAGVLKPGFRLLLPSTETADPVEVWVPNREDLRDEFSHRFSVLARLSEGARPSQAASELNGLLEGLDLSNAAYGTAPPRFRVRTLSAALAQPYRLPLGLLSAAALGLLLLISFNLAAQHLSRVHQVEREAALRLALGASRLSLAATMTARTAALILPAAVLGLLFSWWALESLGAVSSSLPGRIQLHSVGPEMGLLVLVAVFCAGCGYIVPLLARLSRIEVAEGLRASSSRLFSGSRPLRQFLVAAQVAGCVALLMGAVWLTQSFYRLLTAHPGFQAERVVTFASSLPGRVYHSPELRAGFARLMTERLRAIAGVEASGAVSELPLSGNSRSGVYAFPHTQPDAISGGAGQGQADLRYVIPGYFETMQVRLLSGRLFQSADLDRNLPVAVIDAGLARQGWPSGDAVGESILLPTSDGDVSWRTVIGVVETVRQRDLADSGGRQIYLTMADRSVPRMFFVLRHAPGLSFDWNEQIRQAVAEVDPRVGIAFVRPMSQWVEAAASRTRLLALLLGTFAAVSLLLSGMALYAALATMTQERRQEIGLRLALGARPSDIVRWVISHALGVTVLGFLAGLLIALAGWKLYGRLLYQVAPTDWRALLYALLALTLLAACSILYPARRASRAHPSAALRGS